MSSSHQSSHPVFLHNDVVNAIVDSIARRYKYDAYYCALPKDYRPIVNAAAVCQAWRRMALPTVYKSMWVVVEKTAEDDGNDGEASDTAYREKCLSNVGFMPQGCEKYAKELILSFGADTISENPIKHLEQIGICGRSWPEVKLLSMHVSTAELGDADDLNDFDEYGDLRPLYSSEDVMRLACYAMKLVPNVENLLIKLDSRPSDGIDLEQGFRQYLPNITMMTICESVIYHNQALLLPPQLTYLDVNCTQLDTVRWLPGASAAALRVLMLTGVTRELLYSLFFTTQGSAPTVFSELRLLVLYMTDRMGNPQTLPPSSVAVPEFSFPKLNSLLLSTRACRTDWSWEMLSWFRGSPLRDIYLMGATGFAQQFDFARYPDLRFFDALLADLSEKDSLALSTKLMTAKADLYELALRSLKGNIPIPLNMGCTSMYSLYLTTELDAAKLRNILAQLPMLIFLSCNPPTEKFDNSDAALGAEAVAMQIPAHDFAPIHSQLQEIKLHDVNWHGSMRYGMSRVFVDLAATFACIPSLLKVRIGVDFIDGGAFVRQLLTEMLDTDATPHMRDLAVEFGKIIENLFQY